MQDRYIKASELRSFAFCERAWNFECKGEPTTLVSERSRGDRDHQVHGHAAVGAQTASRVANKLFLLSILGIMAAFLWWAFGR